MTVLQLWDDDQDDFSLFGIKSNGLNEAKFVFQFNKTLNIKFQRVEDLDAKVGDKIFCFSLYHFFHLVEDCDIYLIKNLSHSQKTQGNANSLFGIIEESNHILNKHKFFDYFIKIPTSSEAFVLNQLSLPSASFIQNFSQIHNLTNKERKLLFI